MRTLIQLKRDFVSKTVESSYFGIKAFFFISEIMFSHGNLSETIKFYWNIFLAWDLLFISSCLDKVLVFFFYMTAVIKAWFWFHLYSNILYQHTQITLLEQFLVYSGMRSIPGLFGWLNWCFFCLVAGWKKNKLDQIINIFCFSSLLKWKCSKNSLIQHITLHFAWDETFHIF